MQSLWYRNALVYQVDVSMFQDSDGDGWGDLCGLTDRLSYLRGLGITCLWMQPFYRTALRDGGYDVIDHMDVDPRFGTLPDMVKLLDRADELGIRVIVDLVVQHTSDQHPWFQEARNDPASPYRDYFLWSDEPVPSGEKPIFPTVEDDVWTWDEAAGQYYHHIFYSHEPDLNVGHPAVVAEIENIMAFWLRLGVSGFRVDAASHMVDCSRKARPDADPFWLMTRLREFVALRRADAVLLGEVDVPPDEHMDYFGDGHRLTMLANFWLNNHYFLALARGEAEPVVRALQTQPRPPAHTQYAIWARNHDELDLERLTDAERDEVMARFAPEEDMRIYNRGIRRRLPPMLDGDTRRIALAQALLFSLPGTPILRYGEEIGMGEDLSLPERHAVRTAMQWSDGHNAGFSSAPREALHVPLIDSGDYGYPKVNVFGQLACGEDSLLARTGRMLRARLGLPAIAYGDWTVLETGCKAVFAMRRSIGNHAVVTLVNLSGSDVECRIPGLPTEDLRDVLADRHYAPPHTAGDNSARIALAGYGYRWLRPRMDP